MELCCIFQNLSIWCRQVIERNTTSFINKFWRLSPKTLIPSDHIPNNKGGIEPQSSTINSLFPKFIVRPKHVKISNIPRYRFCRGLSFNLPYLEEFKGIDSLKSTISLKAPKLDGHLDDIISKFEMFTSHLKEVQEYANMQGLSIIFTDEGKIVLHKIEKVDLSASNYETSIIDDSLSSSLSFSDLSSSVSLVFPYLHNHELEVFSNFSNDNLNVSL